MEKRVQTSLPALRICLYYHVKSFVETGPSRKINAVRIGKTKKKKNAYPNIENVETSLLDVPGKYELPGKLYYNL